MLPAWVNRYVGIPFADQGFDERGCHCWGLVRLVYLRERGITLPTYGELSARELAAAAGVIYSESCAGPWREVTNGRAVFDVVLMAGRIDGGWRADIHVGVLASPGHVLHVERSTAAVVLPLEHPTIRFRLRATFRHNG